MLDCSSSILNSQPSFRTEKSSTGVPMNKVEALHATKSDNPILKKKTIIRTRALSIFSKCTRVLTKNGNFTKNQVVLD